MRKRQNLRSSANGRNLRNPKLKSRLLHIRNPKRLALKQKPEFQIMRRNLQPWKTVYLLTVLMMWLLLQGLKLIRILLLNRQLNLFLKNILSSEAKASQQALIQTTTAKCQELKQHSMQKILTLKHKEVF